VVDRALGSPLRRSCALGLGAGRLVGIFLGVWLFSWGLGCANSSGWPSSSGALGSAAGVGHVHRPELGTEYDVLVGELAARDGQFGLAQAAFERAAEKDPTSGHLQYRLAHLAAQHDEIGRAVALAERGFALNPEDIEGRLFLARLYLVDHREHAVETVLRGDDGLPVNSDAALLLYQVLLEQGRFQDALRTAKQLQADEPGFLGAAMAVAAAYESMGRLAEAEATLRGALIQHPNRIVIYSRLARMRRSQGDRAGEVELYREVLQERPGHYGTLVSLGEAQIAQNQIDQAIITYSELAELFPGDLQILRRLASLEFGSGRYEEAAERLRGAIRRHPNHHEFTYSLGQVLRGLGRGDEAVEVFGSIAPSHPLYLEARMQIAVYYEENGQFDRALREIEILRGLRSERILDFQAAALRARSGDLEGGVALLEAMLVEDPADVEALYQLGVLYGIHKEVDQSLFYMTQVLEHDPQNAQALNYVGYTWVERGENLDRAEELIEQAVRLSPGDGYIADSLGWVYYMRARPLIAGARRNEGMELLEKAIVQLVLAMELTGGNSVVSEHLGDVYFLMDERRRALHYYEEAEIMSPRLDEQPLLRQKIESLREEFDIPREKSGAWKPQ
jgi:tetratricopeptide (TPR) repeat protein